MRLAAMIKEWQLRGKTGKDRRLAERAQIKHVPFSLMVGQKRFIGMVDDLSMHGALLEVEQGEGLAGELVGAKAGLQMMFPNGEFESDCEVMRVEFCSLYYPRNRIAVCFREHIESDSCGILRDYLQTQLGKV
ncbi:MAG: PilZ domain-containing protein [Myxococcota bacterium]|nr:PilZ domain-containing protein [Myxococcota bacterium]